jgi:hypothetical protein
MDWILNHLQVVLAAAGAVAWWLNQRKLAQKREAEPRKEATFEDPDLAERTRRIREEIQRKIEQRARAYTQTPPPEVGPEPVAPAVEMREARPRQPEPPPLARAAAARFESEQTAGILAQQAALSERLRQVTEMKAAGAGRARNEPQASTTLEAARGTLAEDLRSPEALRRAFILREVLGPPVALR